jgi:acylphosphatase
MKHVNICISGKVQGVFFRATAKEQADQLGIKGFVRNDPMGSVYMEAEGDEDHLKVFLEWCARGPSKAHVDNITVEESEVRNFALFEVRR